MDRSRRAQDGPGENMDHGCIHLVAKEKETLPKKLLGISYRFERIYRDISSDLNYERESLIA